MRGSDWPPATMRDRRIHAKIAQAIPGSHISRLARRGCCSPQKSTEAQMPPGKPLASGAAPAMGPEVLAFPPFAEAEKLMQVEQSRSHWRGPSSGERTLEVHEGRSMAHGTALWVRIGGSAVRIPLQPRDRRNRDAAGQREGDVLHSFNNETPIREIEQVFRSL